MKNILIISHNSLSIHANNGKTLHSLFSGWTEDNLAQLYFQDEIPESLRFANFFRIRDIDIIRRMFGLSQECGKIITPRAHVINHREDSSRFSSFVLQKIKKYDLFRRLSREVIYSTGLWKTKHLDLWIKKFRPDAIFLVGSNYPFAFVIAKKIAAELDIPLFVYLTDDYVLNNCSNNLFEKLINSRLASKLAQCVNAATEVFVIGSDMAKEYEEHYRRRFFYVMNSIEFIDEPKAMECFKKKYIDIVYAGGLTLGRDDALCEFSKVALQAALITGITIRIIVYSIESPHSRLLEKFKLFHIEFRGKLSGEELKTALRSADFLLHVESSNCEFMSRTQLSVSTKIPEYLSLGVCMIAYGPLGVASIKLIHDNSIGIVIADSDKFEMRVKNLSDFFSDPDLCQKLASNGCRFAFLNFNAAKTRALIERKIHQSTGSAA